MDIKRVMNNLSGICGMDKTADGFRITTSCMYPSNSLVRVYLRGGKEMAILSDEGEAVGEGTAAGISMSNTDKLLRSFVKDRGLSMKGGIIYTSHVEIDAAHIAVLHIANAARDVANWVYEHGGVKRRYDFRILLAKYLENSFGDNISSDQIHGASNKLHKFQNVISFANGKKFIVDAVANDASSINSRVVANLDVKSAQNPNIIQRIVFDDSVKWSPSDLSLLQIGATAIPFSRAEEVITRVASEIKRAA